MPSPLPPQPSCIRARSLHYLALALLAFGFWGARPLWDRDEGRYAEAAREMMENGDWLVPRLAGEPHLTKPPMAYWAIAAGMKVFGLNAWGARFFHSLAFLGTILCVARLARLWGMEETGARWAALIFGSMALPFAAGHILTTDGLLVFAETLGVLAFWEIRLSRGRPWGWHFVFWGAFTLAFLVKGPPGWLPLLPLAVFQFLRPVRPGADGWMSILLGAPAMLAASASWFLALEGVFPGILNYFVKGEVYDRIFTTEHRRDNPFWEYFPLLIGGTAPWIFLGPAALRRIRDCLRAGFRSLGDFPLFLILWFTLPFAVFLAAKSRMPLYLAPLMPCVALVFAKVWISPGWAEHGAIPDRLRRRFSAGASVWGAAMLAFVLWPDGVHPDRTTNGMARKVAAHAAGRGPNFRIYGLETYPYSLAFNLRRTIPKADTKEKRAPRFLHRAKLKGEDALLVVSTTRLKREKEAAKALEVIASTSRYAVVALKEGHDPGPWTAKDE